MELFRAHELMAVVVGNENYDWEALEENAEYKNGYTSGDQTVFIIYQTSNTQVFSAVIYYMVGYNMATCIYNSLQNITAAHIEKYSRISL